MKWRKNQKDEPKESGKDADTPTKDALAPPVSFVQLFRYSTPFDVFLNTIGLITALAAGAAQPILALLFGALSQNFVSFATTVKLVQDGQATSDDLSAAAREFRRSANRNALYFVVAGIVVLFCTFIYMYAWAYTSEVNSKRIREHYLQAVLRQDVEYFDEVGAGEVATRIQSDTHLVQEGISEKVAMAAQFTGSFIAGFVLAYTQSWRLALAMTSILPCIAITGALMGKFMTRYTQMSTDGVASAGTITEEAISTIRTAKAFGIQSHLGALFDDKVTKAGYSDMKLAITQGLALASFFFVNYAAYGLAFSFGTTLINRGLATAGDVITVFMSIFIGSFSLSVVAPQLVAITSARGAAAKLFATIDHTPSIDSSSPSGAKPSAIQGEIKLEDITFSYPSRPDVTVLEDITFSYPSRPDVTVLENVSMTFTAGKSYALVGPSGSGKSTIVSLLERFYDPKNGTVTLDGADLKSLNIKWLRRKIGLVSQEPVLFGTTVRDNVAFGLAGSPYESATEDEKSEMIKQACIKANAHEFISRLPKGYDTLVGERGFMLSGGQKQRVAIARAIIADPRILLLDEATSALDTQSEELVQDALSKATQGRTTITIAHRLSTIKNSDKIFVMSAGKVVEEGSHEELMNLKEVYFRLVEAQGLKKQTGGAPTPLGTSTPVTRRESMEMEKEKEKDSADLEDVYEKGLPQLADAVPAKPNAKEKNYSSSYLFMRMASLVRDEWANYMLGAMFSIAVGLVYPAFGILYSVSIDGFAQPDPHVRRLKGDRNALWFFVIAILSSAMMGAQSYFLSSGAATLTTRLRQLSFRAVMRQDVQFFDSERNSSGILTSRINGDPGKVKGLAGITLGTIIQGLATITAGVVAGLVIVWKVGLVGMACVPLLVSAGWISLYVVILKDARNKEAHAQSAQIACESTAAIRTVAALTREEGCLEEYKSSLGTPLKKAIKSGAISKLIYSISQASTFWVIALIFWYGSLLFSRLEITVFQLFVGLMSTTFGALQAGGMFQLSPDMSAARMAAADIVTLLDSSSSIESGVEGPSQLPGPEYHVKGTIEARNVQFAYPTRPNLPVLKGINFTVEPGQYVAFVGASGSGKSTIVQLIQRFYDVNSGSIYIDGRALIDLDLSKYRQSVALVSQEPTLYSGSLKFNILLGATKPHSEVTQEEIEAACRKANILEFVQGLPDGFDTTVGNKGSQLSGGQKQRIAIARALIRNPKVLLLDEATSALDSASEQVVQAALDEAAKGRTTIAIAHRLSTIQDADKIYFIKDGRISESGTHNELLSLRGDYYNYVQLQTLQQDT
ncbi:P-loop containing nucleoside triphosphate hydrolase protein [Macrolepiota fuliginosa MF-IS2]|uniref:P-loop containing nucleoside triphosphate hydrolase protein n=1 Tax=Macrolepiota fuliginosa MF-IS2 TaxID=1400762 RepID=A0A9P5X5W2_9AGAR|nr:P-loop containing nucleoside triphosphate hydrolase protein [Macrolepiota fuliginosa MF-IS2]